MMSNDLPAPGPGTREIRTEPIRVVFRNPTGLTSDKRKLIERKLDQEKIDVFAAAETFMSEAEAEERNPICLLYTSDAADE